MEKKFKNSKLLKNKIKKILFIISLVYIFFYVLNYIYLNETLHFSNWYCLIFILFCSYCLFLIDLKNILKVVLLYIISSLMIFFIKRLDISFVMKAIGNRLSETQFVVLLTIFIIDFLLKYKLYIKNKNDFRNKENLEEIYPDREKDKEYIINFLKNKDNKNINTLGIDSDFGTGKTFLINEVIKELDEECFYVIKIRCLLLEKEEIYLYILKKIKKILLKNLIFTTSFEKIRNTFIKTLDSKFLGGISDLLSPNISTDEIDYFKEVIGRLDKKIILIFDDIDRIQDTEKIERIFSFISDFSINNIKVLVLYNSENLKNINKRYNRHYLEKYIPLIREISNISFIDLLKKEIKDRKLEEEDFKFLYILEQKPYMIYLDNYQKNREVFKFIDDFLKLTNKEIKDISLINISPRIVKNFIEETLNYFLNFTDIDKRIIIAYTLLKHTYYEKFYEKIENNKSFNELFPIDLKFKDEKINLNLQDFDLLKNIIVSKEEILLDENNYTGYKYKKINGKKFVFDSKVYGGEFRENHIDYYLEKINIESKNKSIREKINTIENFIKNFSEYNIEDENLIMYILFNYPVYLNNDNEITSEKIDRIEKAIKKLKFFGNKEYLSANQKFYSLFLPSLKKKNLKIILDDFIKLHEYYHYSNNKNSIFYMFENPYAEAMQAIRILGTIQEQKKFLKIILVQDKNIITDTYIEAFLNSAVNDKETSEKIIDYFLENKIKIKKIETINSLIKSIDRIILRFPFYNINIPKEELQQYLKEIKKYLYISKKNYLNAFSIKTVRKTRVRYFKFITKFLKILNSDKLEKNANRIKITTSVELTEMVKNLKKIENKKIKEQELEVLFENGDKNLNFLTFDRIVGEVIKNE